MEKEEKPDWHQIAEYGEVTKAYWAHWDSLKIENGVLYKIWGSADGLEQTLQLILPKAKVEEVLREVHDGVTGWHLGINKTLRKIGERFYWLHYTKDVQD